jgi:hypothetical protein
MKIGHIQIFNFGVVYYLVVPFFVGYFKLFKEMTLMKMWHAEYMAISPFNQGVYFFSVVIFPIFFWLGSRLVKNSKRGRDYIIRKPRSLDKALIFPFIGLILFFIIFYLYYKNVSGLFSGYKAGYNSEILGQVATINMLCLFLFLYSLDNNNSRIVRLISLSILLLSSLFLLGFGSRMYVLVPLISIFAYKTIFSKKKWSLMVSSIFVVVTVLLLLLIGLWRLEYSISLKGLLFMLLAEPLFTWFSTASYLNNNQIPLFSFPLNYLTSVVNFIPTFILPSKAAYISSLHEVAAFSSPLGATSIYVGLVGNFGIIFSYVFTLILGYYYSYVRLLSKKYYFFIVYYCLIYAILPFQFFRDGFAIFNKQLFFSFLILPMVFVFAHLVSRRILIYISRR